MFNDAWFSQALHMSIAAFVATGFAVAGVHALMILRNNNVQFHKKAFKIAAVFGAVAALLQPISGDISAKDVASRQPIKLAAMEAHFHTQQSVPFILGGIPDDKNKKVDYAIEIPGLLSFLAFGNFNAEVKGLDSAPADHHPPIAITHYAFQVMIILGVTMMMIAIIYFYSLWKKKEWLEKRWLLKLFVWPLQWVLLLWRQVGR